MGLAVKPVYPHTHYGSLVCEPGWKELLPAGCYGDHPAWYASVEAFESLRDRTALIPWLLFNRHLWEEQAEALPGGSENLNLLVPRGDGKGAVSQGWYVRLMLSEDLEIQGLETVSMEDESAPSPEGFEVLPMGPMPPRAAGPNRRRVRLLASVLLLAVSVALVCAIEMVSGAVSDRDSRYAALEAELRALQGHEASLRAKWINQQSMGITPGRSAQLLMDAMWFDAQIELDGPLVKWKGEQSHPFGMSCDPAPSDGNGEGWRDCRWNRS
ncbi:MAG: hypothetical protein F4Y00_07915 [Bacteroidetes bacterium SB0662_bin_6]|nr:hypothetical protein [Bacteroidetes bacterium SB0662_bin_6]